MKKIDVITELSQKNFHQVRTSIFSFIQNNKWFQGKLYLLVHKDLTFSQSEVNQIAIIYNDIEIINCSTLLDTTYGKLDLDLSILSYIKRSFPQIQNSRLLYFSNLCLFRKEPEFLSESKVDTRTKDLFFIEADDLLNERLEQPVYHVSLASEFNDIIFNSNRSRISSINCLIFNTFLQNTSKSTLINQVWLEINHRSLKFLQDPKSYVAPKNKISLELIQPKQNSKVQKKQTVSTQKKTVLLRNEPLIQREPFAIKDIDKTKVRATVAMPLFNMGQIATLALEGLCNQKTDYLWELVVCEEVNDKCLGRDVLYSYEERLRQANCVEIKYQGLSEWVPLSKKWRIIASMSADTDCFILQAGDCYAHSKRIECTVNALATGKYNYYDEQKGYFYSFKHNKTILFSPNPATIQHPCRLNMAWKTSLFKKLPAADARRGVDGFIYNALSGFEKIQTYRNVGPYEDGVDVDGYNMISSRDASFLFLKKNNAYVRTHVDMVKVLPILNNYKNLKLTVEKIK